MSRAEALAEAQRRWGPTARISYGMIHGYRVGTGNRSENVLTDVRGKSNQSWEAAFLDADRRLP